MVLPQLSARQANRQRRGTSMHTAQRIMVNKDKYPHTMGSNPAQGITVGKCHIHPSLLLIKDIHQLQTSPLYPDIHPLLGNRRNIEVISQLYCPTPAPYYLPPSFPPPSHALPPPFSKLVVINVYATHWAVLIK